MHPTTIRNDAGTYRLSYDEFSTVIAKSTKTGTEHLFVYKPDSQEHFTYKSLNRYSSRIDLTMKLEMLDIPREGILHLLSVLRLKS